MQRRIVSAIIAALLCVPMAAACSTKKDPEAEKDIRLYQVLPVARKSHLVQQEGEGEMIALINAGSKARSITGWVVQTEEGKVLLPSLTLDPGQVIYLADDAKYFESYWNFRPSFEYGEGSDDAVPDLKLPDGKPPALRDRGDVVRLLDDQGKAVDILAYGNVAEVPSLWTGPAVQLVDSFPILPSNQVITRLHKNGSVTTMPRAEDWSGGTPTNPQRVYFAGQSDFPVTSVSGTMTVTAASAPDNAGPMLYDLIARTKKTIRLAGYQFTNEDLADRLIEAVKRGVHVTVALERNPGGKEPFDSDKEAHQKLASGGVEVLYYFKWDGDLSTRFNPVHSKYGIFDDETVLIASGNWTNSVYSLDPTCGNREWVATISGNPDVVKLFDEVWSFDFGSNHTEVRRWDEMLDRPLQPDHYDPGPCMPYTPIRPQPLPLTTTATVTRILSPDNTMDREKGFLGLLRGATQELLVSANYINKWWGAATDAGNFTKYPDPYISEIVAAARRKVSVKVLLDRKDVNAGSLRDNQYVVEYLNDLARKEGLTLEARLVNMDGSGIGRTYHNKSLIVDGGVVISSINGSENSFRYAREMALRIDGVPEFTSYFRDLFTHDWEASKAPNAPWNVIAMPRTNGSFIDWTANVERDVVKYAIYYKADVNAPWRKIAQVTRPGYEDTRLSGIWGVVAIKQDGTQSGYAQVSR